MLFWTIFRNLSRPPPADYNVIVMTNAKQKHRGVFSGFSKNTTESVVSFRVKDSFFKPGVHQTRGPSTFSEKTRGPPSTNRGSTKSNRGSTNPGSQKTRCPPNQGSTYFFKKNQGSMDPRFIGGPGVHLLPWTGSSKQLAGLRYRQTPTRAPAARMFGGQWTRRASIPARVFSC